MSHVLALQNSLLKDGFEQTTNNISSKVQITPNQLYSDPLKPTNRSQRNWWAVRGLLTTTFIYFLLFCALGCVLYKLFDLPFKRDGFFMHVIGRFVRRRLGNDST